MRLQGHRHEKSPVDSNVIQELKKNYRVILKDTLEADDALVSTQQVPEIIVSLTKTRRFPKLYDFKETAEITPEEEQDGI